MIPSGFAGNTFKFAAVWGNSTSNCLSPGVGFTNCVAIAIGDDPPPPPPFGTCDDGTVETGWVVTIPSGSSDYFNNSFGVDVFPMPQERHDKEAIVPGTDGKKMSKSYGNTIDIFAEGSALKKSVMGIVTDSTPVEAPKDVRRCNVAALYALFATEAEMAKLASLYANPLEDTDSRQGRPFGYGDSKKMLLDKINGYFGKNNVRSGC